MANWNFTSEDQAAKKPIIGIYCFTCKRPIYSKRAAQKGHVGHDVDYVDEKGSRQTD